MTLQEKGRGMRALIDAIRVKRAEQDRLLALLEWQAGVLEHGIDPQRLRRRSPPREGRVTVYLDDGTAHDLPERVAVPPKTK